jgi:protein-tyrosine phosphatase
MWYGFAFFVFGVVLTAQGFRLGGWWLLLLWPAVSFFVVAAAYVLARPGMLGKRPDGRLSPPILAALAPFTAFAWAVAQTQHRLRRGPVASEVLPGIWVGRRAGARDLPAGVSTVIDLTAEFWEPAAVRDGRKYLCVPTLDARAPDERSFRDALDCVAAADGPVYIHCAQGFGRSAALAAALLVRRGVARDVREAEAVLQVARPGVRLTACQRELVRRATSLNQHRPPDS